MKSKWIGFWVLGLIWGSSYLFIRIGVEAVSPFQLVFMRTAIGATGLTIALYARGYRLPAGKALIPMLVLGLIDVTIPYALITWGEQTVDSGMASVLFSTTALFTLIISALVFRQEAFTARKFLGILLGFAGVAVLTSGSFQGGALQADNLTGQLALLAAAVFYAFGGAYSYRQAVRWEDPQIVASGSMIFAALTAGLFMLLTPVLGGEAPTTLNAIPTDALLSIFALGLLNTLLAYMIYYWIVKHLGASRTNMVLYVSPAAGITLGALVLGEVIDVRLLIGAAMILAGIAIVTLKPRWRRAVASANATPVQQMD